MGTGVAYRLNRDDEYADMSSDEMAETCLELFGRMQRVWMAGFGLDLHSERGMMMSTRVNQAILDGFGVTADQIKQDALENAPHTHPASLRSMQEVLGDMMGGFPNEHAGRLSGHRHCSHSYSWSEPGLRFSCL